MSMQGHLKLNIVEVKLYIVYTDLFRKTSKRLFWRKISKFRRLTEQIINENTIVAYNYLFSIRGM